MKLWPLGVLIALASCQEQEPDYLSIDPTNWDFHRWVDQRPEELSYPISLERTARAVFRLPQVEQGGGEYLLRYDLKLKDVHQAELLGDFLFTMQADQDIEFDLDYHLVLQEEELLGAVAVDPDGLNEKQAGRLSMSIANQLLHAEAASEDVPLGAYLHPAFGLSSLTNILYCDSWEIQDGVATATLRFDLRPGSAGAATLDAITELMDIDYFLVGIMSPEDFWYFFKQGAKEATATVSWEANTGTLLSLESEISLRDHRINGSPVAFELEVWIDTELRPTSDLNSLHFALPENAAVPYDLDSMARMFLELGGMEVEYEDEFGDF